MSKELSFISRMQAQYSYHPIKQAVASKYFFKNTQGQIITKHLMSYWINWLELRIKASETLAISLRTFLSLYILSKKDLVGNSKKT